jgi:hypothetical protein
MDRTTEDTDDKKSLAKSAKEAKGVKDGTE